MKSSLASAARWGDMALRADLRDRIAQDSFVVLLGQGLRLGLGIISSALLARSLGPEGLSVFTVVGAATGIMATVADLGLRLSSIRQIAAGAAQALVQARRTASVYARLKLLAALLATLLILLLAEPLARLLNLPPATGALLLRLGSLGLLATASSGLVATILQALRRFRLLVAMQSANVALTVVLMAALWWRGQLTLVWALLVGAITAAVAALLGYFFLSPAWRAALWRSVSLRGQESRHLLSFSRWMWLSNIFSILTVQVDVLLLNYLLPLHLVGIYALARSLALKADILNQTLHTVLTPNVSALAHPAAYRRYLRRSLVRSFLLALLIMLALPLARPFILLVYGAEYAASVNVFYALMVLVLFDLVASPLVLLALPMNRPHLLAAADGLQVVVLLAVGVAAIPMWSVYGVIIARLAARLAGTLVTLLPIFASLRQSEAAPDGTPEIHHGDTENTEI